jgi:hypothetical protein
MVQRGKKKPGGQNYHPPLKPCEWCGQPLPTVKYHLRICPDCRKASIDDGAKKLGKTIHREPYRLSGTSSSGEYE